MQNSDRYSHLSLSASASYKLSFKHSTGNKGNPYEVQETMPPKRNRRGAKDLVETAVESEFDASYAEDELTDIKSEVEARCQMIAATAREMQDKLRMVLQTNLIRVPKKLKRMEIKDFVAEYGQLPDISCGSSAMDSENADPGYPQTALKGAFGEKAMAPPLPRATNAAATPRQTRTQGAGMETPAHASGPDNAVLATPKFDPRNVTCATPGLRTARKGETVMSVNGSPIAADNSVILTAMKAPGNSSGPAFELSVLGDALRLGSPSAKGVVAKNPFMQKKLEEMQEEINSLLGQINVPGV